MTNETEYARPPIPTATAVAPAERSKDRDAAFRLDVRQTVAVRTVRLEAFSDGVFAIAATLLVLELRVPPDTTDLVGALVRLWPAYAAYLVSFLTIGIIWVNHHTLLEHCTRVDRRFLYLNLLLLIAVGIVPFPTALTSTSSPSVARRRRSSCTGSARC